MSYLLPSLGRTRRRHALPPHGYEGRRAEPLPVPAPMPAAAAIEPPSAEVLAQHGVEIEAVGFGRNAPLRIRHRGFVAGVFLSLAQAAPTLNRLCT